MSSGQGTGQSSEGVQDQGAPLTAEEKRLVQRLFSEPLEFPTIFRNWLKNFIETAGIQLPKSAIASGIGGQGSFAGWPAGVIVPMGGSTPPAGSLVCNGQAVSRQQYKDLFAAISTIWGAGDGSTTFNLPDLRDRALYSAGANLAMAQTDGQPLGSRGGPFHHHQINQPISVSGYISISAGGDIGVVGDHQHAMGTGVAVLEGNRNAIWIDPIDGGAVTQWAGAHNHPFVNGWAAGNVSIPGTLNAPTQGGGALNTPGFAGVQYVITT